MTLTHKEIKKVNGMYDSSGGNAKRAGLMLEGNGIRVTYATIIKYWRDGGRKINYPGGRRISDEEIKQIKEMYKLCEGNSAEAERRLKENGISVTSVTVRTYWKKFFRYELNPQGGKRISAGRYACLEERL